MRNNINKINKKMQGYRAVRVSCLFCRVLWNVAVVMAAAALSAYLVGAYRDRVIIALGVAAGLFALVRLVNLSYRAEAGAGQKRK